MPGGVTLVDLHPLRGGIEVLLGVEDRPGARWPDLAHVRGSLGPEDLDGVLPRWGDVAILGPDRRWAVADGGGDGGTGVRGVGSAGRGVGGHGVGGHGVGGHDAGGHGVGREALAAVLGALVVGSGVVVVDLPASAVVEVVGIAGRAGARVGPAAAGPSGRTGPLAGRGGGVRSVLVTSQDVVGVAAGLGTLAVLTAAGVPAGATSLVVRGRPGARVAPPEVAHALGPPLLTGWPEDLSVAGATDRGLGPVVGRRSRLVRAVDRAAVGLGL